ncbi:hypothetical protein PHJA_001900600 [Phtheirospermum japonicum]|uniref:Uncharacterized protein n=1 Tax=Phtheirospermum japonicum TaxID=374723 RepID=A0A830CRB2_9LAMI|nr:hypothetical protein PHJA_001900600 [Phtheirospermum japonicum]
MLPSDLAFTLLLPSGEASHHDLRLNQTDSDAYAILTSVLGFLAVPRLISTMDLDYDARLVRNRGIIEKFNW